MVIYLQNIAIFHGIPWLYIARVLMAPRHQSCHPISKSIASASPALAISLPAPEEVCTSGQRPHRRENVENQSHPLSKFELQVDISDISGPQKFACLHAKHDQFSAVLTAHL